MTESWFALDPLAESQGGLWDYVSPSRLGTWLACPLKFKLKYIDGVQSPMSRAMFLGKTVHRGLEDFYRHRQLDQILSVDEVMGHMTARWGQAVADEDMRFTDTSDEQACRQQAISLVRTYLDQIPDQEPRPLAVEIAAQAPLVDPANGESLGLPLVGVVDLVLPDRAGPLLVDFKTSARNCEPLEVAHEIQLTSYAYILRHTCAIDESGLEIRTLIKTKTPQAQFHRYPTRTTKHFCRLFGVIRAYLDDLDSGKFIFRPGLGCGMCEFRTSCLDH